MKTFKAADIFQPTPESEYSDGNKSTVTGWLRELFLYNPEEALPPTDKQFAEYERRIAKLMKLTKCKCYTDLFNWEEKTSPEKAATVLNKVIK